MKCDWLCRNCISSALKDDSNRPNSMSLVNQQPKSKTIPYLLNYLYCIVVMRPDVQTLVFSRSYLHSQMYPPETLVVKGGTTWARNGRWVLPENARLPRNIQGSFTCRKSTTWDKRLYFPFEGRRAEDFFALKNPTASAGFEPANLGTKGKHADFPLIAFKTRRCPLPLDQKIVFTRQRVKFETNAKLQLKPISLLNYGQWRRCRHVILKGCAPSTSTFF